MNDAILDKLYLETGIPLDRLPYTANFDTIRTKFIKLSGCDVSDRELLDMYQDRRKRGLLPRLGRGQPR